MSRMGLFVAVLATMTAVACDTPSAPQSSEGPGLEPDGMMASQEAVTARAVGSAHRELDGRPIALNFSAVQRADGSVSGEYYFRSVAQDLWIRSEVTCMTVVGNTAWVAGIAVASSPNVAFVVGRVSYFFTTDNGEGPGAEPDVVSLLRANDVPEAAEEFCTELPMALPDREVLHGNVNVTG